MLCPGCRVCIHSLRFQYVNSTVHVPGLAQRASREHFCAVYTEKLVMKVTVYKLPLIVVLFTLTNYVAGQQLSIYSKSDSKKTVYKNSDGTSSFNIEVRGRIDLTDDDKDIKSMSPDGYLEITKTAFGSRRSLIITPQGSALKREYYEGRTSVPFEPAGRKWMSEILPEVVRTTTIGAESRVSRFFRQGGTNAVLDEISRLESDYVKAHYANALMGVSPQEKDFPFIVNRVAGTIESDYYLTEFLQNNLSRLLKNKESANAVFAACGKMESDHYKTEVIKAALRDQPASLTNVQSILDATGHMESDHYKTEVLTTLLKQENLTDAIMTEVINSTQSIQQDYYRSLLLNKVLSKSGLSNSSYQMILESVRGIESDHYKTEVLTHLLDNKLSTDQIRTVVDISTSIESDHYTTIVFNDVLKQDMSDEAFGNLIDRVSHIGSDYYMATVLQSALNLPKLSNAKVISVLSVTGKIESDHYITEVLLAAAPRVKTGDAALKDAYRSAAKKIESETYYGRAIKAIE